MFAIGVDCIDQVVPSKVATGDDCTFAGRARDVAIFDFTDAAFAAGMIVSEQRRIILPGLVFSTDSTLGKFTDTLGTLSSAPYCTVLPGSVYQLREIPQEALDLTNRT
jgi:hypothetical protein